MVITNPLQIGHVILRMHNGQYAIDTSGDTSGQIVNIITQERIVIGRSNLVEG